MNKIQILNKSNKSKEPRVIKLMTVILLTLSVLFLLISFVFAAKSIGTGTGGSDTSSDGGTIIQITSEADCTEGYPSYCFDEDGFLNKIDYGDPRYLTEFIYDSDGDLVYAENSFSNIEYRYDSEKRLKSEIYGVFGKIYSVKYEYDGDNINKIRSPVREINIEDGGYTMRDKDLVTGDELVFTYDYNEEENEVCINCGDKATYEPMYFSYDSEEKLTAVSSNTLTLNINELDENTREVRGDKYNIEAQEDDYAILHYNDYGDLVSVDGHGLFGERTTNYNIIYDEEGDVVRYGDDTYSYYYNDNNELYRIVRTNTEEGISKEQIYNTEIGMIEDVLLDGYLLYTLDYDPNMEAIAMKIRGENANTDIFIYTGDEVNLIALSDLGGMQIASADIDNSNTISSSEALIMANDWKQGYVGMDSTLLGIEYMATHQKIS